MVWSPTQQVTDVRPIVRNLLTYFRANQADALNWANGGAGLADFTFYETAEMRMKTDFPHFGIVKRRTETDTGDVLTIQYNLTFEFEVMKEHTTSNRQAKLLELQTEIDNRGYALESMFLNIPDSTLFANVRGAGHGYRSISSSDPLEAAISDTKSLFNVQMAAILRFTETPYA